MFKIMNVKVSDRGIRRTRTVIGALQKIGASCPFAYVRCILLPGYLSSCPFQAVGVADEFIQHVDNLAELWPFGTLFLPAIQHQLVQRNWTVHGWRQSIAFLNCLYNLKQRNIQMVLNNSWKCIHWSSESTLSNTYILVTHVPIWPFSIWHHFPHDNAVTPYIRGGGELPVCNGFWSSPANRYFASLWLIGSCYFLSKEIANTCMEVNHTHACTHTHACARHSILGLVC